MVTNAKESKQIKKVRKKLEKILEEEHSHFNRETLNEVRDNIYKWIARHEPERVSTKEKTFKLFDENAHSSNVKSAYVKHLQQDLEAKAEQEELEKNSLLGRITYRPEDQ